MTETIPYTLPPEVEQLDAEWREYLVHKLDWLHEVSEWDARDNPVTAGSIATFIQLVSHVKPVKKPGFGVANSGGLIAAWADGNSHLTVGCWPETHVQWTVVRFKTNTVKSASGICPPEDLLAALAIYGPERWFGK